MIQQIFIIYHGDILRKKHIDDILNSTLLNRIPYEFIYSNSITTKVKYINNSNISYNEYNNIIDHYNIWEKISETNSNESYLIIDDSVTINKYDLKFMSTGLYILDIIESIKRMRVMDEWDIIYLYHNWIFDKQPEISINKYIDIPHNDKRSDKSYLISTNGAKKLIAIDLNNIKYKLSEIFYKKQYDPTNELPLYAFSSKISLFIDDNTNQDISQYIKIYSKPVKPTVCDIDGIKWYITIIVLVNDDFVKDDFYRFLGVMYRYKYHVIPIHYNESFTNKQFIKLVSQTLINFKNQHYKNTNIYDKHVIMFMSSVLTYINCSYEQLIRFFIKMNKDILLSKPTINITDVKIPDILINSDVWLAKFSLLYDAISNNHSDIKIGYDMNNDYIICIDDPKFVSNEFEYDTRSQRFICNVVNSINKYPFIFYSIKSFLSRFIIHDIWNILPQKGNIIRIFNNDNEDKTKNILISVYLDDDGYKNILSTGIDEWVNKFIHKQILPYNVGDIDYIMYTDNLDIYNEILKHNKYNIYFDNSIHNLWLNILKNNAVNYEYILWISGNILVDNIHMIYDMVMTDVPVITPHITGNKSKKVNCVNGISKIIIKRNVIGIWTVPHIQDIIFMRNDIFNNLYDTMMKYQINGDITFEKYICNCLMVCGYNMWYINTRSYGKDIRL
jgi:hypothetical protein